MNIILTGIPRSGTTLACSLLHELPNVVALVEPIPFANFVSLTATSNLLPAAYRMVHGFFEQTRSHILNKDEVFTYHENGSIVSQFFSCEVKKGGLREEILKGGNIKINKLLNQDFILFVKHTTPFLVFLPDLSRMFQSIAFIRNPLAILASWNSIQTNHRNGRLQSVEMFVPVLSKQLESESHTIRRQLLLLNWYFKQIYDSANSASIIKYEQFIESPFAFFPSPIKELSVSTSQLLNHNINPIYDKLYIQQVVDYLLKTDGYFWHFYTQDDVIQLHDEMIAQL